MRWDVPKSCLKAWASLLKKIYGLISRAVVVIPTARAVSLLKGSCEGEDKWFTLPFQGTCEISLTHKWCR